MISKKVIHFQIINQIQMVEQYLVCFKCKNWLTTAIYIYEDGLSCEDCHDTIEDKDNVQNVALEQMLANFRYPCKYTNCDAIHSYQSIQDHQTSCKHAPVSCLFCSDEILSEFDIANHLLKNHSNITAKQVLTEPTAKLNLNLRSQEEVKVYILELQSFVYTLFLQFRNNLLSVAVAKQNDNTESNETFKMKFLYNNGSNKITMKGEVSSYNDCCNNIKAKANQISLNDIINNEEITKIPLKVCFNNYRPTMTKLLSECPICMHRLTSEIYMCRNGHSICTNCKKALNTCATCRTAMLTDKIPLKHLISNMPVNCPNDGCLQFVPMSDLDDHLKNCMSGPIQCKECESDYPKRDMIKHMLEQCNLSTNLENNLLVFNEDMLYYILFDNNIFLFDVEEDVAKFEVSVMYNNDVNVAQKYRYEIQILDTFESVIAVYKFTGICGVESKPAASFCGLDLFKQLFYPNFSDTQQYYIRFCVFHQSKNI